MRFKTRWMMKKEFEALAQVVEYLDDERKDYEARKENGEPTRNHIGKALKILAAYVEEIDGSFQAIGSAIEEKRKRDRRAGRPPADLPNGLTTSTREPHRKRARPSLKVIFKEP